VEGLIQKGVEVEGEKEVSSEKREVSTEKSREKWECDQSSGARASPRVRGPSWYDDVGHARQEEERTRMWIFSLINVGSRRE
jgi:hypothetical protein